jgi:hypothetical protein
MHRLEETTPLGFQLEKVCWEGNEKKSMALGSHRDDHYLFFVQLSGIYSCRYPAAQAAAAEGDRGKPGAGSGILGLGKKLWGEKGREDGYLLAWLQVRRFGGGEI